MDFLDKFKEEKPFVKIGMELYYAEGPEIVRQIKARGHKIFLDLKLHDIIIHEQIDASDATKVKQNYIKLGLTKRI